MNKLSELYNKCLEKWKSLSKKTKIASIVMVAGVIIAIVALIFMCTRTKYDVLFGNMDPKDAGAITNKLKEKKIDYKVKDNSILVPHGDVDRLRLEVANEVPVTNGSRGWELFENNKWGVTDEEMKVTYQRALEGELERTIKSFAEIDNARVHLVMPQDSAFVKDSTQAKASVIIKLKPKKTLSKDQVKSIVSLLCGSVKNLSKEDVEVMDDQMNLLTKNLYNNDPQNTDLLTSTEKQQEIKKGYEKKLEEKVLNLLEPIYKDKVRVKVNADVNFDAIQEDNITYAPKGTIVSEHNIKDNSDSQTPGGPVGNDPNLHPGYTTPNAKNGSKTTHEDSTKNYEISKKQDKIIKAPGEIKRLTTSVVLDGRLDDETKTSIKNLVVSAIGYVDKRDNISVEGLPFDTTLEDKAKKDLEEMEKKAKKEQTAKMIKNITLGVGALALLAIISLLIIKSRKKNEDLEDLDEGLDITIGDEIEPKENLVDLNLHEETVTSSIEKQVKEYAIEKPDQVTEVVKSWLAEDER